MFTITLVIFLFIEMIWQTGIARKFYKKELGALMRAQVNGYAAGLFYLIYTAGIVIFVIRPNLEAGGAIAFLRGGGFGFVAYSTYNLISLAIIENWPIKMTIVDIVWGSLATGLTAFIVVQFY